MTVSQPNVAGLTSAEAKRLQDLYGKNELSPQKKETFFQKAFHILCEPMFLLLIAAAIIYFILGEPRDGAIMLIFVVGIIKPLLAVSAGANTRSTHTKRPMVRAC